MCTKILSLSLTMILATSYCVLTHAQDSEIRTWKDITGKYQVVAKFVEFKDNKVYLQRENGSTVAVPSSKLSASDMQFVRNLLRSRRAGTGTTTTAKSTQDESVKVVANGDWPRWRGPNLDGISNEKGLMKTWPANGPTLLWESTGYGRGYSSIAIADDKIFTMGKRSQVELICSKRSDGRVLWQTAVGRGEDPNCTPTVDPESKLVFAVSHAGDLLCANMETGAEVWRKNFGNDFGGKMMSQWGYSESPLVDGDLLIVTPGAPNAMLAALNKRTGAVVWATPAGSIGQAGQDGAGYSSVVIGNGGGVKQYIQLVGRGVIGVEARTGRPLWSYNRIANTTANVPTPIVKGDFVFCSSGYNDGGSALLQLAAGRGQMQVREVYYRRSNELQNHHGGMILLGDHLYFGHGHNKGFPVCVNMATGQPVWGPGRGIGSGSAAIVYADGHLYFRYEDGTMALIEATPTGYNLKSSFKIASNRGKSWPHPVISQGMLYLRDQDALLCYDISQQ